MWVLLFVAKVQHVDHMCAPPAGLTPAQGGPTDPRIHCAATRGDASRRAARAQTRPKSCSEE